MQGNLYMGVCALKRRIVMNVSYENRCFVLEAELRGVTSEGEIKRIMKKFKDLDPKRWKTIKEYCIQYFMNTELALYIQQFDV